MSKKARKAKVNKLLDFLGDYISSVDSCISEMNDLLAVLENLRSELEDEVVKS
jgi:hypothetical protein